MRYPSRERKGALTTPWDFKGAALGYNEASQATRWRRQAGHARLQVRRPAVGRIGFHRGGSLTWEFDFHDEG